MPTPYESALVEQQQREQAQQQAEQAQQKVEAAEALLARYQAQFGELSD